MESKVFQYKSENGRAIITGLVRSDKDLIIPLSIDGNSVEQIADNAFMECANLETVTLPTSLNKIGNFAFFNCKKLKEINLERVQTIGSSAFQNCESLGLEKKIILSNELMRVEDWTFSGCKNLKHVELGDNLTYIGHQAFALCDSLEEIDILTLQKIEMGSEVFFNVRKNCQFRLPFIGSKEKVFSDLTQVKNFDFTHPLDFVSKKGIKYERLNEQDLKLAVGNNKEFCGKAYIASEITFEGLKYDVTKINNNAFYECKDLTGIVIPESIVEIGKCALAKCESLTSINMQNNSRYYSTDDSLALVEVDNSKKAIIAYALGSMVESFNVPEDINSFARFSMHSFKNLKRIVFKSANPPEFEPFSFNEKHKDNILKQCTVFIATDLKNDELKEYKSTLEERLKEWWDKDSIKIFGKFTDMDTKISYRVVDDRSDPKTAEVSENREYTGDRAVIKEEVEYAGARHKVVGVGSKAFWNNKTLKYITLPKTIVRIGEDSFNNCSLKEIDIPESVIEIGKKAFYRSGLESVIFNSVVVPDIGQEAFEGLSDCVATIPMGKEVRDDYEQKLSGDWFSSIATFGSFTDEEINYQVINKAQQKVEVGENKSVSKTNIIIKEKVQYMGTTYNVVKIGDEAFYNNKTLKTIKLPETIVEIGKDCFNACTIEEIKIPKTVEKIGERAFMNSSLINISFTSAQPPTIEEDAFSRVSEDCKVHVPKKYSKEYQQIIEFFKNEGLTVTCD